MPAIKRGDLTMSDIVLLRLLSEQPMHGHQAAIELERQQLSAWTGISRPQVYWSLNKLAKLGLIVPIETNGEPPPRHRRVFTVTEKSRVAIENAFRREYWSTQNLRPLFLAWMLLASPEASTELLERQISRRRKFLERKLAQERETLATLKRRTNGTRAAWVVGLHMEQLQLELRWLSKLR